MKLALSMIIKGDEADLLTRCLKCTSPHVDGIFITYTRELTEKTKVVCDLFNVQLSYFKWESHFAKARNYNFAQIPKEFDYILWLDVDDVPRNIELLKKVLKDHPMTDALVMHYLYWFDQYGNPEAIHLKTRVVKNDGSFEWRGRLHEDFHAKREIVTQFVNDIEILHLTNEGRVNQARERNLAIALEGMEAEPTDPRSYWNLANAQKAADKPLEAMETFKQFISRSKSDEEKYVAYLRMAEIMFHQKDMQQAMSFARYAIGMYPDSPEGYNMMGYIYFSQGEWEKARQNFMVVLEKPLPIKNFTGYNIREFDFEPLYNLAKIYIQMNRPDQAHTCLESCMKIEPKNTKVKDLMVHIEPLVKQHTKVVKALEHFNSITDKEKLRSEMEKLDPELQSHPLICYLRNKHFVKETSTGKDISYFCGYTEQEWTPLNTDKGIGGSEEAVIHLSEQWAQQGYNVTVYNNCGHKTFTHNGVIYKPFWMWNYRDKQDVVILWRHPRMAEHPINAQKVFLDLHDVLDPNELTERRLDRIDKVFVKSKFHRSIYPMVPDSKAVIIPNGINSGIFKVEEKRDPYLLINTSSPDRGLAVLLELFARVQKKVPQAKLKWAYGWTVFDIVHGQEKDAMEWKSEVINRAKALPNVELLGRISQTDTEKLYLQANIFAYPTEFAEISCISAMKAQAAGAIPVTTDFAALNETVQFGVKIHSKKTKDNWCRDDQYDFSLMDESAKSEWVREVVRLLRTPFIEDDRDRMRTWAQETFNWSLISNNWLHYVQS